MSFEDYHELTTKLTAALRDEIITKLDISYASYYKKLKTGNWTASERDMRERIYKSHIESLISNLIA
jgi:hypothetical protein